jgi:hypothetical protein
MFPLSSVFPKSTSLLPGHVGIVLVVLSSIETEIETDPTPPVLQLLLD